jgi:hypothetical protein
MGASFFLYYLGLFGNVEGPLEPSKLGERLAHMGVTKTHVMVFLIMLFVIALTWNWLYNLMALPLASRLGLMTKAAPAKKGIFSHTLLALLLAFCVIVFFCII